MKRLLNRGALSALALGALVALPAHAQTSGNSTGGATPESTSVRNGATDRKSDTPRHDGAKPTSASSQHGKGSGAADAARSPTGTEATGGIEKADGEEVPTPASAARGTSRYSEASGSASYGASGNTYGNEAGRSSGNWPSAGEPAKDGASGRLPAGAAGPRTPSSSAGKAGSKPTKPPAAAASRGSAPGGSRETTGTGSASSQATRERPPVDPAVPR